VYNGKENPSFDEQVLSRLIDLSLDEVRSCPDVSVLNRYRQLFRKRVPLHLRAYVAARLLQRLESGAGMGGDKRKKDQPVASRKKAQEQSRERQPKAEAKEMPPEAKEPKTRHNRYRGEGVVLFVNAGRRQRFYARIAIGLLEDAPGVGASLVGDVRTMDNYSFIEVAPEAEDAAIAALTGFEFKGRSLVANRARKKGELAAESSESTPGASEYSGQDDEYQAGVDGKTSDKAED